MRMSGALRHLVEAWRDRQRRHKERLAVSKRFSRDATAWAELFRREDWAPPAAGHYGRCGQCGARINLALVQCPRCGAEWKPNARRSDLYRQVVAYGSAIILSVAGGYVGAVWLRAHFALVKAKGEFVNSEMVDTLASFSWILLSVLMMIGFTYAIERLAPMGHWRNTRGHAASEEGRRKSDARA